MKVFLAGNLTATAVAKDKLFQPAIDDGEHVYIFSAHLYSGRGNAVDHAQKTIDGLQRTVQQIVKTWSMEVGPSGKN